MSPNRPRILVVDDEPAMVHAVRRILEGQYAAFATRSSEEAISIAREVRPHLAILDIRMPDMDGFELMSRLRDVDPELDVIFMTGVVNELDSQLIRAIRERAFYFVQKPFDRDVLLALVERCLELRRLADLNARYVERLEQEVADARAFQQSMLPPDQAHVGGLDVHARFEPCDELGGDFYEFASGEGGRATLMIADVSGHGASAAMLTGIVKSAFHASRPGGYDPEDIVGRIAVALRPFALDRFLTAICIRVTPGEGRIDYVNAGHPPGLLLDADGEPRLLDANGLPLSPALADATWTATSARWTPESRILLYTDGITEAESHGEIFGHDRLVEVATTWARRAPDRGGALLDDVLDAVRGFLAGRPADDDLTLVTAAASAGPTGDGASGS